MLMIPNMLSRSRQFILKRFLRVNIADLRKGDWIELEGGKTVLVQNIASSHSGRGSRSFLMTVKDVITDSVTTIKPMGRDNYEKLELRDTSCKYLYSTDGQIYLLDEKTLEEFTISSAKIKDSILEFLEDGMSVKLRFALDKPIGIVLPKTARCTVAEILENAVEGTDKKGCVVKLKGGAKVNCSVSLQVGDGINVDTEDLTFQGRY